MARRLFREPRPLPATAQNRREVSDVIESHPQRAEFFARPLEALPRPDRSSTRCAQHFTYSAALMLTIRD